MNVIEKEFDALAPVYETNRLSRWYQAHTNEILKHCSSYEEGDILDVGCGTGHFLRRYLKSNPGMRGVGLDVSTAMIREAREKAELEQVGNVEFIRGDFERISLQTLSSYDFKIIVCANAFHYFANPQQAAEKLHQLLRAGGTLFVLERNKASSPLTVLWAFLHRNCIKDRVQFYAQNELLHFFEHAGFTDASVVQSIRRYLWKGKLFTSIVLVRCHKQ